MSAYTPWAVESLIRWTQKEVWAQDLTVTLYCVLGKDISLHLQTFHFTYKEANGCGNSLVTRAFPPSPTFQGKSLGNEVTLRQ